MGLHQADRQGGSALRVSRISNSRSTYDHSSVARRMPHSSSNAAASTAANSNQVRKSNGSPRSRPWWRRRAIRGRYGRLRAMWCDRSSKIARRWSCVSPHHSADLRIGIRAAVDADGRPNRTDLSARALRSSALAWRSGPVTPRKTHDPFGAATTWLFHSTMSSFDTVGRGAPLTAVMRSTDHAPLSPPTKATLIESVGFKAVRDPCLRRQERAGPAARSAR